MEARGRPPVALLGTFLSSIDVMDHVGGVAETIGGSEVQLCRVEPFARRECWATCRSRRVGHEAGIDFLMTGSDPGLRPALVRGRNEHVQPGRGRGHESVTFTGVLHNLLRNCYL